MLKTYTIEDLRELKPCYDPTVYLPEDWDGTLLDILDVKKSLAKDRIWVVTGLVSDKTNRLFACWCADQALSLLDNPDPTSLKAVSVAKLFANGQANSTELAAARAAARAAWDTASPASAAARTAARNAAWDAAWASAAARTAASAATGNGDWNAARAAAWAAQVRQLRKMIEASGVAESE